jgi:predicted MFS family arabinose efflux permease
MLLAAWVAVGLVALFEILELSTRRDQQRRDRDQLRTSLRILRNPQLAEYHALQIEVLVVYFDIDEE